MGFLLSRIYRAPAQVILVLKPSKAKRYTVVEEFFPLLAPEHRVAFRYANDCLVYNKVILAGRALAILEMHDHERLDFFWDCVHGMHSVVYFVERVHQDAIPQVLHRLDTVQQASAHATILLVVVAIQEPADVYTAFKKKVKALLEGRVYRIVDGLGSDQADSVLTKEAICQGFAWMLRQTR